MKEKSKFVEEEGFELLAESLVIKQSEANTEKTKPKKLGIRYNVAYDRYSSPDGREENNDSSQVREYGKEQKVQTRALEMNTVSEKDKSQLLLQIKTYEEKMRVLYDHNNTLERLLREMKTNLSKELDLSKKQHQAELCNIEQQRKSLSEEIEALEALLLEQKVENNHLNDQINMMQKNTIDLESIIEREIEMKFTLEGKIEALEMEKKSLENNCKLLMDNVEKEIMKADMNKREYENSVRETLEHQKAEVNKLKKSKPQHNSKTEHFLAIQEGLKLQIRKHKKINQGYEEKFELQEKKRIEEVSALEAKIEKQIEKNKLLLRDNEELELEIERLEAEINGNSRIMKHRETRKRLEEEKMVLERKYNILQSTNQDLSVIMREKVALEEKLNIALGFNSKLQSSIESNKEKHEQRTLELEKLKEIVEEFRKENENLRKKEEQNQKYSDRIQVAVVIYIIITLAYFMRMYNS